VNCELQSA